MLEAHLLQTQLVQLLKLGVSLGDFKGQVFSDHRDVVDLYHQIATAYARLNFELQFFRQLWYT